MWRMIWEKDSTCIVMLCQTLEDGQVGVQSLLCRLRLWYNAVDASVDSLSIGELLLFLA